MKANVVRFKSATGKVKTGIFVPEAGLLAILIDGVFCFRVLSGEGPDGLLAWLTLQGESPELPTDRDQLTYEEVEVDYLYVEAARAYAIKVRELESVRLRFENLIREANTR